MVRAHEFDGERCIHCGVNIYDCDHTDSECCVWRKPTVYTTESVAQSPEMDPEKRAALRAFADSLPAKHIDLTGAEVARKYDEEAAARQIDRSVWMTRDEAAALIGLPWSRIKPLIDRGALRGLQRGKRWYVERRSAQAYKNSH